MNLFNNFLSEGLRTLVRDPPISSLTVTSNSTPGLDDEFNAVGAGVHFEEPKYGEAECRERDMTYAALYVKVMLHNKETDQHLVQDVYMGDFPLMTEDGTLSSTVQSAWWSAS